VKRRLNRRPKGLNTFALHKNIKTIANQRLIKEGRDEEYRAFVRALKDFGIEESGNMAAWKIALLAFAPMTGGPGEIKADPYFADIAARWAKGDLPKPPPLAKFPSGMTNFGKLDGEPSAEFKAEVDKVKQAPKDWDNEWEALTLQVMDRTADPAEVAEWVVRHNNLSLKHIDIESVPDPTALTLLKMTQGNQAALTNFVNQIWAKLLPDRKTLEYEAQFKDKGQDLQLLDDEEAAAAIEESAA
jgi:hypothetical protein